MLHEGKHDSDGAPADAVPALRALLDPQEARKAAALPGLWFALLGQAKGEAMTLPSLEVLDTPRECAECGEPIYLIQPDYCPACADRLAMEKRRDESNARRRLAQFALDMELVREHVRSYVRGKR